MTRHERELKALEQTEKEKALRIKEVWDKPEKDPDYEVTQEERDEVADLTKDLAEIDKKKEEVQKNIDLDREVRTKAGQIVAPEIDASPDIKIKETPRMQSLGEQFVESNAYKSFWGPSGQTPSGDWRTDTVDLSTKATMTSGGTISGAGPYTEFIPGITQVPTQQLTVADLLPSNNASAPQIQFFKERIATNNAAGVAEAAGKPESVIDFNSRTLSLAKVATFLPVTEEMLEDAPQIQGYINSRLSMFVRTEEERQILRGLTASNEVEGFINNYTRNGVGTAVLQGTAFANRGTAVFNSLLKIMNNQRGSSQMDPTALIVHPNSFGTLISRTDSSGQFYGGGALQPGAYGAGRAVENSRLSQGAVSAWTVPIYVTTAVGAGTMLLGNFSQGAALHRKGGISVQASNSHSDFFKKNLTAIRAEERLALTVYRPEAFTVIRWK